MVELQARRDDVRDGRHRRHIAGRAAPRRGWFRERRRAAADKAMVEVRGLWRARARTCTSHREKRPLQQKRFDV
jgi:hypothetical protein